MLIDITYFTSGPRQIENAVSVASPSAQQRAVSNTVDSYIRHLQGSVLDAAVGSVTRAAVEEYLELSKDEHFEEDNDTEVLLEYLRGPFADYVFYYILRDAGQQPTITGLVELKSANSYVEPLTRQAHVWNRMADGVARLVEYCSGKGCPFDITVQRYMLMKINPMGGI